MELIKTFEGEQYQALHTALIQVSDDDTVSESYSIYNYLENTPAHNLITEVVDKLNEMGYTINKSSIP